MAQRQSYYFWLSRFLQNDEICSIYHCWRVLKADWLLVVLKRRFDDYVFRCKFLSYVRDSLKYHSWNLKKQYSKKQTRMQSTNDLQALIAATGSRAHRHKTEIADTSLTHELHEVVSREDLSRALKQLTERQTTAIHLLCVENMTEQQAASKMGISHQAVNRLKQRAKKRILRILSSNAEGKSQR